MGLLAFLRIQIRAYIFRKRWLLPIPVMAFIGYRIMNFLIFRSADAPGVSAPGPIFNAADALFIAFGNGDYLALVIANLFLFLVCDLLPEPAFGQMALLRLRSRRTWWAAKCLTLLVAVLAYTLLAVAIVASFAAAAFPIELGWSAQTSFMADMVNLPFGYPDQVSMPLALGQALLLFMLGCYGLGLLMMVVSQLTQRYLAGYLAGIFALFASYVTIMISGSMPAWTRLFVYKHMLLASYPYPFREMPLSQSFLYWGIWLALLAGLGLYLSKRQDHLALRGQA